MELFVGLLNPNNLVVNFLSIGNEVPAKAPVPRGFSFNLEIQSSIQLSFSDNLEAISRCNIFIVSVPKVVKFLIKN